MLYTPELAEICGIHAGDGYMRNVGPKVELDISGSLEEESYYDEHVIPMFSKVFRKKLQGKFFPSRRTYGFVIRDREIVEKMHEIGFPYGAKSTSVRIPKFILNSKDNKLKTAFLRGFFDTDGSLSFERKTGKYCEFKRTHNYYPRLQLVTVSEGLAQDMKRLLEDLEIPFWSDVKKYKRHNWKDCYRIWIRGNALLVWMKAVGMKNPTKLSRYQIWKKFGHCPPNTSFAERLSILSGDIKIDQGPVTQFG